MSHKRLDYNRIADEQSLNGWSLDDLVARLVNDAVKQYGTCGCTNARACVHAAAAALHGLIRIVQHPDDCEDCARLRAQRESASESSE